MENKLLPNKDDTMQSFREDYSAISLMHYSQLLNFIGPFGLIIPLVLWSSKKLEIKDMDIHGKNVINFQISLLIYIIVFFLLLFVSFILALVLIGFIFMFLLSIVGIALFLLTIVPPILGGLAASRGEIYKYPMSIKFIK